MKKVLCVLLTFVLLCSCTAALAWGAKSNAELYENAIGLLKENKYTEAGQAFAALGSYSDSPRYVMYCNAIAAGEAGNYATAASNLSSLNDFLDSPLLVAYYTGLNYEQTEEYESALDALSGITLYRDVAERILTYPEKIQERDYKKADAYEQAGNLTAALNAFKNLGSYKDSADRAIAVQEKINEETYAAADKAEQDEDYATAYDTFTSLGNYKDSENRAVTVQQKASYEKGLQAIESGNYDSAYSIFTELGNYKDSQEKAYILGLSKMVSLYPFGGGMATFCFSIGLNTYYGLINFNENLLFAPQWYNIYVLADGMIAVDKGGYGIIDEKGNMISEYQWSSISNFNNGVCVVARKNTSSSKTECYDYMLMDKNGKILSSAWKTLGESYTEKGFSNVKTPVFYDDLIVVTDFDDNYGFINSKGEIVVEPTYTSASNFSNGLALVVKDKLYGYIDTTGNVVIPIQYSCAWDFSEDTGLAIVRTTEYDWQIIDATGAVVYFE